MSAKANEKNFQEDMLAHLLASGWLLGKPENYNRELALYAEDVLGFVKETQDEQWQKFCALYPNDTEQKFLERVAAQLNKTDPNAANKEMRTFGTLGVLRHELRDRGTRFSLCQFKPEHDLNPDTLTRYRKNRCRVVPELVYSPWAKAKSAETSICKPAVERWQKRYKSAVEAYKQARDMFERAKKTGDAVLIANTENTLKECKLEKDTLEIFKKDLGTFVRCYEFMSQIVDYDDKDLEKLSLYARNLRPMLRETILDEDDVDLDNVVLSHYRLSKIRQQDLQLKGVGDDAGEYQLQPGEGLGSAKAKDKKEEFLSQIIYRLNELFITDQLTDKDMVNYAYTIRDKVGENALVMKQLANNSPEQALLGDFTKAVDDAIMDSGDAHQNQMMQLLSDPAKAANFAKVIFDLLKFVQ